MFNFQCAISGNILIKIFDVSGREVATLINEFLQPGTYQLRYTAPDEISSGVYFYTLTSGNYKETKRMILLK